MSEADRIHSAQAGLDFHPGQRVLDAVTGQDGTVLRGQWQRKGAEFVQEFDIRLQTGDVATRLADQIFLY